MNNKQNNQAPGVQITPALQKAIQDAPFIKCIVCGGIEFIQEFHFKTVSPLLSPIGVESEVTFATYACKDCGHVRGVPAPAKS